MAIPLEGRLKWRHTAPFHIQLELERHDIQTVSRDLEVHGRAVSVLLHGRAVRVFRTDGRVAVGDRLGFDLWVCRPGYEPDGVQCIHYENFKAASFMEAYLYGDPPECQLAAYEFNVIGGPSDEPTLTPRQLEELLEQWENERADPLRMRKETKWWRFWRR